jgi:3-phenylpropionate/cinnamic acid dioxygenase small subunit
MSEPGLGHGGRGDISDVLIRYASGIDRRDWALFRTCFTDDCDVDYGDIGSWSSVDEITEWMTAVHEPCGHTMHRMTNIAIEAEGEGRARASSYVDAVLMNGDNTSGMRAVGFYDDELVRTDEGWRIARRRYTMVHVAPVS